MDLVSFDSSEEFLHFAAILHADRVGSVWTSGRKCNMLGKGCEAAHLQPVNVRGWFWAGEGVGIPATDTPSNLTFWSRCRSEQGRESPTGRAGAWGASRTTSTAVRPAVWRGSGTAPG
jgi:hypothetical protein